jgi:hypothetical protein
MGGYGGAGLGFGALTSLTFDKQLYRALITRNGGEVAGDF